MRSRNAIPAVVAVAASLAVVATLLAPASAVGTRPRHVLRYRAAFEARVEKLTQRAGLRASAAPTTQAVLDGFSIVGHTDLGGTDINGDVWVHDDHAYVGTWGEPCNGLGVKIVDVSDPANPVMIGRVAGIPGTSAEDVVVRSITTPSFTGDLLVAGIQRCDFEDTGLDDDMFGVDLWNVTNPSAPQHLAHLGLATGGGGVHELDLIQRGSAAYVLAATPWSEWFDPNPAGDFRIVDVTNPAAPVEVGDWGAGEHGFAPGPYYGIGSFGSMFAHSARASSDGTRAYVSFWDLGVVTLDITDVTDPTLVSQTLYPAGSDGDAHSVVPYSAGGNNFLLQNDEDFDISSPPRFRVRGYPTAYGGESPFAQPLYLAPNHRIRADVVRPRGEGCSARDYLGRDVGGAIAVVRTYIPWFDVPPEPEPSCRERKQDRVAESLGAVAVVHDVISDATSPQWFDVTDVSIPVLFATHGTARVMVRVGRATIVAPTPSWGFLRVFDASTGEQVASFSDLPYVHELEGPGFFSIHNTEVNGDRAYAAWYSNGVAALDLSPLTAATPSVPVLVGRFVPDGAPSPTDFFPDGLPLVWGVFVRGSDGLVFATDMLGGLWIVRPEGDAAP